MIWLRIFALALLVAPPTQALAQRMMSSINPTMEDVDPGIDHTGRDRDLPSELRRQWGGVHTISKKAEWPDWTPPPEMISRQPYLPRWMAGGPGNPLGARALYIGATVYRIHGTNAPETIGQAVSSGCFRMVNDDVVDLYARVPVGTKVMVQHQ
jgi:hypothetical protein